MYWWAARWAVELADELAKSWVAKWAVGLVETMVVWTADWLVLQMVESLAVTSAIEKVEPLA